MRLHIIGIPSSGKTTLAKGVSTLLSVPHHDLDSVAFVDEHWTLRPIPERDSMIAQVLEQPNFVSEGGFLGWTEALFASADYIIWLDPPLPVLLWRHVRRHRQHPRRLPSLLRFQVLMYLRPARAGPAKDNPDQSRAGIESALRPWAYKVFRSSRPVAAVDVLEQLGLSPSTSRPLTGEEDSPHPMTSS